MEDNLTLKRAMNMARADERAREQAIENFIVQLVGGLQSQNVQKHDFSRQTIRDCSYCGNDQPRKKLPAFGKSADTAVVKTTSQRKVEQIVPGISRTMQEIINVSSRKTRIASNTTLTKHLHCKV